MLNFQGNQQKYYYMAPCDYDKYITQDNTFPFYLEGYHMQCFWRGNEKGCLEYVTLTIPTHPTVWEIDFGTSGTDRWTVK